METRWLMMPGTTRRKRRFGSKRGVSGIIAAIFLILIIFVAFGVFTIMFNSFVAYTQQANKVDTQLAQNQQTSLSSGMQFGSPVVPAGSSNPPKFNVNSIGVSTVQTHYPFERKLVYSQGLWWTFYSSGSTTTGIVYQTSQDGITWSDAQTVISGTGTQVSYGFSVWLGSGAILYFVLAPYNTGTTIIVGSVPLQSSGTIGTVTTLTLTLANQYRPEAFSSITNDTSGNIWVATNIYKSGDGNPHNRYVEVYRCPSTLTACTAEDGTSPPSIGFGDGNDIVPMILGLSNGALAVL
ncbi:MAG: hypothetical protein ACREBS_09565, partial [Nitrososphaerales archaeon]